MVVSLARLADAISAYRIPLNGYRRPVRFGRRDFHFENALPAAVELLAKAGLKLAERRGQATAWQQHVDTAAEVIVDGHSDVAPFARRLVLDRRPCLRRR